MFPLRTLIFSIVSLLIFRPICGEAGLNVTDPIKILDFVPNDIKTNKVNVTKDIITKDIIKNVTDSLNAKKPPINLVISDDGSVKVENRTKLENNNNNKSSIVKPIIESQSTQYQTDNNTIIKGIESIETKSTTVHVTVGRKGVLNEATVKPNNITSSTNTINVTNTENKVSSTNLTVSVRPKKPTVTIRGDDEGQMEQKSKNGSSEKFPTIEYYQRHKEQINKADFVIPIVAVILSVPVVAIVLNILYKRGKEWWSHRHYRRMDFLIDGMYNN